MAKLLEQMRDQLRTQHMALRTERSYLYYAERYIRFNKLRHPKDMGTPEVTAYLTHLAVDERVSASTQNVALSALLYLYRMLGIELDGIDAVRARPSKYLLTVS